jgi:uncharacterized membrane protein YphA (DoxX/SURF4 family)
MLIFGGLTDIVRTPYVRSVMEQLGYPAYFAVIIGVWKVPGGVALLVPGFPRLKEWAYAGAFFNFTGAAVSPFGGGRSRGHARPADHLHGPRSRLLGLATAI